MKMEKTSNSDLLCWNFCPIFTPKAYLIINFGAQTTKWKVGNSTDIIIMPVIMEQKQQEEMRQRKLSVKNSNVCVS